MYDVGRIRRYLNNARAVDQRGAGVWSIKLPGGDLDNLCLSPANRHQEKSTAFVFESEKVSPSRKEGGSTKQNAVRLEDQARDGALASPCAIDAVCAYAGSPEALVR